MRILFALTYYRPHVSGLTIYVQRLAEALAADSHQVTVLTSRYDRSLSAEEVIQGVRVVRVPVLLRISKGVIMPRFFGVARRLIREHDVVSIQLPQFEAPQLALLARLYRRPAILTYHCDLRLPRGPVNRLVDAVVYAHNHVAGWLADAVVAYTDDYAESCTFLRRFRHKRVTIPPPVDLPSADAAEVAGLKRRYGLEGVKTVGFAARLATEKGVEYMLAAIPRIAREFPRVRVLFAGPHENIVGEEGYRRRLQPLLDKYTENWTFLGTLDARRMAVFYAACDVTVLPSINSTESFGLVQVESMLSGVPVVASDLPGVRVPVRTTGMGLIVPPRDSDALADAVIEVLRDPAKYRRPREQIVAFCSTPRTARRYVELFERLRGTREPDYLGRHLRELPAFRALLRAAECRLMRQAGPFEGPLLDLGCGDGSFAAILSEGGEEMTPVPFFIGVDASEAAVRQAAKRGGHRRLAVASATGLPFADGAFASVMCNSVIEHIPDRLAVLREVARVLRPGGRFVFTTPSHRFADMLLGSALAARLGLRSAARSYGRWFNAHSRHFHTLDHEIWLRDLAACGFEIDDWRYYMSPRAHRIFDLLHYLGAPRLLTRRLTGRWVLWRSPIGMTLLKRWLAPLALPEPRQVGPYLFFAARRGNRPL